MTREDVIFAKKIYNDVIINQTLRPDLIKEAYRRLTGEETPDNLLRLNSCKAWIWNFFEYKYRPEMIEFKAENSTDTVVPTNSAANTDIVQSHSEDQIIPPVVEDIDELPNEDALLAEIRAEARKVVEQNIAMLEAELHVTEEVNKKRSLRQRINNLKKKL